MSFSKAACMVALGLALVLGAAPARADNMFDWITIGGVCYDYDPYDRYHEFGRYYPYSGEYCRHRARIAKHKAHKTVSVAVKAGRACTRTNVANFKNACRG